MGRAGSLKKGGQGRHDHWMWRDPKHVQRLFHDVGTVVVEQVCKLAVDRGEPIGVLCGEDSEALEGRHVHTSVANRFGQTTYGSSVPQMAQSTERSF